LFGELCSYVFDDLFTISLRGNKIVAENILYAGLEIFFSKLSDEGQEMAFIFDLGDVLQRERRDLIIEGVSFSEFKGVGLEESEYFLVEKGFDF
jgi:hypothetical protein